MPNLVERICQKCGVKKDFAWKEFTRWLRNNPGRDPENYYCSRCATSMRQVTHGETGTPLYKRWKAMFARTRGQGGPGARKYYLNKGIQVCAEWYDFKAFQEWSLKNGFDPALTIDRIDGNKGYSPENCRWVTKTENLKNRSKQYGN